MMKHKQFRVAAAVIFVASSACFADPVGIIQKPVAPAPASAASPVVAPAASTTAATGPVAPAQLPSNVTLPPPLDPNPSPYFSEMAGKQRESAMLQKDLEIENLRKQLGTSSENPKIVSIAKEAGKYYAHLRIGGIDKTVSVGDSVTKNMVVHNITATNVYVLPAHAEKKAKPSTLDFVAPDNSNGMPGMPGMIR